MRQWRDQIRTEAQLERCVSSSDGLDVYHSIAYFCNPASVSFNDFKGKKGGYQVANNLLVGGDLVFDIDARTEGLNFAKQEALRCCDWLLEKGYHHIAVFSGRGFHVRVTKHDLELREEGIKERLREYRRLREPLIDEMRSLHIQVDPEVTLSPKSLIRLIGTVNSKTGSIVRTVDLNRFDVERASSIATHGSATPQGNDDVERIKYQDSLPGPRMSDLADTPTNFLFIGTKVFGTINRQVVLLRFPLETSVDTIRNRLESLVKTAGLAPFVFLESLRDTAYYALSPSAIEKGHIKRLLKDFREAKAAYAKFSARILPLPVRYICTIGTKTQSDKRLVISRAHSHIVEDVRIEGVWNYVRE